MFIGLLSLCTTANFGESLTSTSEGHIKCISINNRPCQARATLVNISCNKPKYYPCVISAYMCGGSCNTIDVPYTRICVPNKVNNKNVKVFNLVLGVNKTSFQSKINRACVNVDCMKVSTIQTKNGIIKKVGMSLKH